MGNRSCYVNKIETLKPIFEDMLNQAELVASSPPIAMKRALAASEDMDAFIESEAAATNQRLTASVSKIFDAYDTDLDTKMSRAEIRVLMDDYFYCCREYIPRILDVTMDAAVELVVQVAARDSGLTLSLEEQQHEQRKARRALISYRSKQAQIRKEHIATMYEDPETYCNQLYEALDADSNGSVSKQEFQSSFIQMVNWLAREATADEWNKTKAFMERLSQLDQIPLGP